MNKDKLRKSIYHRVRLRPMAKQYSGSLNWIDRDDDWSIEQVTDEGVRIGNLRTGHSKLLGFDHIHHYVSDPGRNFDGFKHGFLILTVQLYLDGWHVRVEPASLWKSWISERFRAFHGKSCEYVSSGRAMSWMKM